jgi:RNA polymerase sigma-70 factor (ECF subfamily)
VGISSPGTSKATTRIDAPYSPDKTKIKTMTVEELVLQAQVEQRAVAMPALEELVRRNQKVVYVTLYQLAPERQDIADLTQEALLRMCRSIRTLKNPKTFKFWLNRIITNLFYDELRKSSRQLRPVSMDEPQFVDDSASLSASRDIPDTRETPDKLVLNNELDQKIQSAIASLPEQFRTMIVLREVQNLCYDEIATLTNTNIGTVKSRLARARMRLQEMLGAYLSSR